MPSLVSKFFFTVRAKLLNSPWKMNCRGKSSLSTGQGSLLTLRQAAGSLHGSGYIHKYVACLVLKCPVPFMNCVLIKCHITEKNGCTLSLLSTADAREAGGQGAGGGGRGDVQ